MSSFLCQMLDCAGYGTFACTFIGARPWVGHLTSHFHFHIHRHNTQTHCSLITIVFFAAVEPTWLLGLHSFGLSKVHHCQLV